MPLPPDPNSPTDPVRPLVLVVDDDAAVRGVLSLALSHGGLDARLAASGPEAVAVYREHGRAIGLVLLDVQMPGGLDGPGTLAALREIDPGVRCVFMSGYAGLYPAQDLLALGALAFLPKPFTDLPALCRTLRELALGGGR
jgi:two-component system, OmpR family, response regulator